ncbi:MAG: AfsR/SARP family transcriptional regulator, partial [Vicinamibacterales bacterium]
MILRVSLFDHLRLAGTNGERPWTPRPRARRLLAYLLLQRRRPLSREHVAFTLWPDTLEARALGTLRRALSDLRAALPGPEEWLVVTDTALGWNSEAPYWLDIDAFEQSIREGTPSALHAAIDLYAGDLLATWDDEWLTTERERLRQLQLDALRRLVAHHRALGAYETALALVRRALVHDPLAEAVHRDLMALLYVVGDRAAALAAYDQLDT